MNNRAKQYFLLGEKYFETAKLLLETLINGDNSNAGIGKTQEEAYDNMNLNACKSDLYLFVPAIFNCLQSTELFLKGLLLLNDIDIDDTHEIQTLLEKLPSKYNEKSDIRKTFKNIYFSQKKILKEYRKTNNITNANDLYISLRYPESVAGKQYEYYPLMCNGDEGIKLFKKIYEDIANVKKFILSEYHSMT